jgi:hypothetical protein
MLGFDGIGSLAIAGIVLFFVVIAVGMWIRGS